MTPHTAPGTPRPGPGPLRALALGTMLFGTRVPQDTAFAVLDRYAELGGTILDTANNYAFWLPGATGEESERVLGRWFAARPGARERMLLSTKVGGRPATGRAVPAGSGGDRSGSAGREGLGATTIRAGIRASLARLGTDRVEVYWAHLEDRLTPLAETAEAFADAVEQGLVGELGASNHALWRVEQARWLAGDRAAFTHLQYRYTYLQPRTDIPLPAAAHVLIGGETLDYAADQNLRLWAYSPLLSGAYTRDDVDLPAAYRHAGTTARLAALRTVAAEAGATPNQVVLSWLLDATPGIVPIVGVSSVAQLQEAMGALDLRLGADLRALLDDAAGTVRD